MVVRRGHGRRPLGLFLDCGYPPLDICLGRVVLTPRHGLLHIFGPGGVAPGRHFGNFACVQPGLGLARSLTSCSRVEVVGDMTVTSGGVVREVLPASLEDVILDIANVSKPWPCALGGSHGLSFAAERAATLGLVWSGLVWSGLVPCARASLLAIVKPPSARPGVIAPCPRLCGSHRRALPGGC